MRRHNVLALTVAAGVSALLLGVAMGAGVARADLHDPLAGKGQVPGKPSISAAAPVLATAARGAVKDGPEQAGPMKRIEDQDTTREQEGQSCNHD